MKIQDPVENRDKAKMLKIIEKYFKLYLVILNFFTTWFRYYLNQKKLHYKALLTLVIKSYLFPTQMINRRRENINLDRTIPI